MLGTELPHVVQDGLKAQKLLVQGNTLGISAIRLAPYKGKSFQSPEYKCDTITAQ